MRSTIDKAGRVVIPKALRDRAGLCAGAAIEVAFRDGHIEIEPVAEPSRVRLVRRGRFLVAEPLEPVEPLTVDAVNAIIESIRNERMEI